MLSWLRLVVVLAMIMMAGCASQDHSDEEQSTADIEIAGSPACFYGRQVSNFVPLDRSRMMVYAPTKSRAYVVKISPPSSSLRFADALGFRSRSGRICGYAGERLVVDRTSPGRAFSIVEVTRVSPDMHDSVLAQFGRGPAAGTLEPEESTGADVERELDGGTNDSNDKED